MKERGIRGVLASLLMSPQYQAHLEVVRGDKNHHVPLIAYSLIMFSLSLEAQGGQGDTGTVELCRRGRCFDAYNPL